MLDRDLRRALGYIRPYRSTLAVVAALSLAGTALSLALPWLTRDLVDGALLGRDRGILLRTLGAFGAITLVNWGLNVVSGLAYTRASAGILFDMRLAVYRHLQRLSPRFFARMPLGQIASRINTDIGEIQRVAAETVLATLSNVVVLVGTVAILLFLDPVLFLIGLATFPLAIMALVRFRSRLESAVTEVRDRSAGVGSFLIETLQGIRPVVAFNAQEREVERFRAANDGFVRALLHMRRETYLAGGIPGLLLSAGSGVVIFAGGWRVISGATTLGTLAAFIAYQMRLFSPVQALMGLYASLASARVSLRRVHEILDAPLDVTEATDAVALPDAKGAIVLRGVHLRHPRGDAVLAGVDLDLASGSCTAIVGASGGGKSTIADLLTRQLDPDAGSVALDGIPLPRLRLADVRRHILVVEQDPFLFNASIADNIRYARPAASDADVLEAARGAGLGELFERSAEGIHTSAGERGRALSSGERQRVAIARALLANPAVLVLDEATGSLDPLAEGAVLDGYVRLMRGRTTILITHRPALAKRAERIVVLEGGTLVEDGTPTDLLARDSVAARLFGTPTPSVVPLRTVPSSE